MDHHTLIMPRAEDEASVLYEIESRFDYNEEFRQVEVGPVVPQVLRRGGGPPRAPGLPRPRAGTTPRRRARRRCATASMRWSPSATTIRTRLLHRIETGSSSPSVGGMKRLLARLELIEATGVLEIDVGWVNGNY